MEWTSEAYLIPFRSVSSILPDRLTIGEWAGVGAPKKPERKRTREMELELIVIAECSRPPSGAKNLEASIAIYARHETVLSVCSYSQACGPAEESAPGIMMLTGRREQRFLASDHEPEMTNPILKPRTDQKHQWLSEDADSPNSSALSAAVRKGWAIAAQDLIHAHTHTHIYIYILYINILIY